MPFSHVCKPRSGQFLDILLSSARLPSTRFPTSGYLPPRAWANIVDRARPSRQHFLGFVVYRREAVSLYNQCTTRPIIKPRPRSCSADATPPRIVQLIYCSPSLPVSGSNVSGACDQLLHEVDECTSEMPQAALTLKLVKAPNRPRLVDDLTASPAWRPTTSKVRHCIWVEYLRLLPLPAEAPPIPNTASLRPRALTWIP